MSQDLYSDYSDEAAFRAEFVMPLLTRLGFKNVQELHGQNEFGKDIVFEEAHILAGVRYSAAQVKHEKRITQSHVPNVERQVDEAFSTKYLIPKTHREARVSSVYVLNSGVFADNARTSMAAKFQMKGYGENVFILDGRQLMTLATFVVYEQTVQQLARLRGLRQQLYMNLQIWNRLHESPNSGLTEVQGSLLSALEEYIANPVTMHLNDGRFYDLICELWGRAKTIDRLCAALLNPCVDENWLKRHQTDLQSVAMTGINKARVILNCLDNEIRNFAPMK